MPAGGWIRSPSVGARLAIGRHDVETPHLLAVVDPERAHPTMRSRLRARRPDIDQIAVNQWRHADEIAFLRIGDLLGPERMTVRGVERQQKAIVVAANDLSVGERRAAVRVGRLVLVWRPRA